MTEQQSMPSAGNGEPRSAPSLVSVSEPSEAKRWQEQAEKAEREAAEALRALRQAETREVNLSERLRAASKALVDANQELAQAPLLKHRLAEMHDHNAGLQAKLQEVLHSRSWQTTEVLRKISRALKLQR